MDDEVVVTPPRRGRRWKWFGAAATLFMLAAYCGIAVLSAHVLTHSHQPPADNVHEVDPRDVSARATAWSVRTDDGLTLRGWYHPTPERRRLVVLVHGLKEAWQSWAELGRDLHARGYDVLSFDFRGHGRSDASRITLGRRERQDLRAVLAWAKGQGFTPDRIGWIGFSMGAATLVMEGAENPDFRLAVIDSPFGDLPAILDEQLARHSHLPRCFNPGILAAANYVFGVRTDDLVPIRYAPAWKDRPLLVIHGEKDHLVPVAQAQQIADAAGPNCRAVMLPGVDHVRAYPDDPEAYVATVDAFLGQHLKR